MDEEVSAARTRFAAGIARVAQETHLADELIPALRSATQVHVLVSCASGLAQHKRLDFTLDGDPSTPNWARYVSAPAFYGGTLAFALVSDDGKMSLVIKLDGAPLAVAEWEEEDRYQYSSPAEPRHPCSRQYAIESLRDVIAMALQLPTFDFEVRD